jgi:hypothetical protein
MFAVENWLNGQQNFFVGRSIYKTLGKDQRVKDLLEKGKTVHSAELLVKAMKELLQKPVVIAARAVTVATEEMPDAADPVLKSIQEEWKKPYQQMNYKRHELDSYLLATLDHIEKRKKIAFEILELEQVCIKIWKKRDHYVQHGELPDVSDKTLTIPTDPAELGKLIESVKKNIRRNRLLMKQHPDKPAYISKYNTYKDHYKSLTGKEYEEKD